MAKDGCLAWPVVTYSAKGDTPQTVQEARQNNAARKAFCG